MVFVLTEKNESFGEFLFGVPLAHFGRHDSQEIIVVYWDWSLFVTFTIRSILARACVGQIRNKSFDLFFCWLETKCSQGNSQFFHLDGSRAVGVEKLKSLLNLILLGFC